MSLMQVNFFLHEFSRNNNGHTGLASDWFLMIMCYLFVQILCNWAKREKSGEYRNSHRLSSRYASQHDAFCDLYLDAYKATAGVSGRLSTSQHVRHAIFVSTIFLHPTVILFDSCMRRCEDCGGAKTLRHHPVLDEQHVRGVFKK